MIIGINESKILSKHISCQCKCRFDEIKCNSDLWWNNDKCRCECKKCDVYEKDYVWNSATCNCKNRKYLASIMDDSAIICDDVIDTDADAESNNKTGFNEKKATCKTHNFYILLAFLINYYSILDNCQYLQLLVSYLIKYRTKQLLPFHYTNNELKMSNKVKYIDIKNRTYYFSNDIINIKNFDLNNIKINEKSYKNIFIYYIGYETIKDLKYVKINSVNHLHLIFSKQIKRIP